MKVIITAGGTGGHIYPALSIVEELMKDKNNEVLYIGTTNRMESEIVPKFGINYVGLEIYGLTKNIPRDIKNIKCIMSSYKKCKKIMKTWKPDYVIGFGGYVTFPVLMAAHKYKIRSAIHEQNKIPGKTNKLLSKYAETTFISFIDSKSEFKNKCILSGNPCANKAINIKAHDKTKLGFKKEKKLILIVMGSLGSEIINNLMKDFLENYISETSEILFITGKSSFDNFKDIKVKEYVKIIPFYENLSGLMKSCDLIISRAGASTISEILALNLPSILIPSPYVANNHQYYNALELKKSGVSIMLEQKDLNAQSLTKAIEEANKNERIMKDKLQKMPKQNACKVIVEEITK